MAFGGYNGKYHNAVSVYKLPNQQQQQQQLVQPSQQQQQQQQSKPGTPAKQQQQPQSSPAMRRSIEMQQQQPYRTQSTPSNSSKEGSQRGGAGNEAAMANGNAALVRRYSFLYWHCIALVLHSIGRGHAAKLSTEQVSDSTAGVRHHSHECCSWRSGCQLMGGCLVANLTHVLQPPGTPTKPAEGAGAVT